MDFDWNSEEIKRPDDGVTFAKCELHQKTALIMLTKGECRYTLVFSNLTVENHTSARLSLAVMIYVCCLLPVLDEGDIRESLGGGSSHEVMIPFR